MNTRTLRLDLILHDKTKVFPKTSDNKSITDGLQLLLMSCPRDGRMYCTHWEWKQIAHDDWILKLLPTKHNINSHPYGKDWRTIVIDDTMESVDSISELILGIAIIFVTCCCLK